MNRVFVDKLSLKTIESTKCIALVSQYCVCPHLRYPSDIRCIFMAGLLTYPDLHSIDLPSVEPVVVMEECTLTYSSGGCVGFTPTSQFHPFGYQKMPHYKTSCVCCQEYYGFFFDLYVCHTHFENRVSAVLQYGGSDRFLFWVKGTLLNCLM